MYAFLYISECSKNLSFSIQPTLMMTKPAGYAAGVGINTAQLCAELCFRQHYCLSAVYNNEECILSFERGSCSNNPLSKGFEGAALISCIKCDEFEFWFIFILFSIHNFYTFFSSVNSYIMHEKIKYVRETISVHCAYNKHRKNTESQTHFFLNKATIPLKCGLNYEGVRKNLEREKSDWI